MNITAKPSSLLAAIAATNHSGRIGIVGESRDLLIYAGDGYRMTSIQADDCTVDGNCRVWIDAGPLESALKASVSAEQCSLRVDDTRVSYKCGAVVMTAPVSVTAQDFDAMPDPDATAIGLQVDGAQLCSAIALARSVPRKIEGGDYWRANVGIVADDFTVDIAATDSKRIVGVTLAPKSPPSKPVSVGIQPKLLTSMPAMDGTVDIIVWGSWVGFGCGGISYVVRQIEAGFPPAVLETMRKASEGSQPQTGKRSSLLNAARTLAGLCKDVESATITIKPGSFTFKLTTQQGDIELPVDGTWTDEKTVKLPPYQIVHFLSNIESEDVDIAIKDNLMPVVFSASNESTQYTMVVAPCR